MGKPREPRSSQLDLSFFLKKSEPHWPRLDISKYNWVLAAMAKDKQAGHLLDPFFLEDLLKSTCCPTCWFAWLRSHGFHESDSRSQKKMISPEERENKRGEVHQCASSLELHRKPWLQFTFSKTFAKMTSTYLLHTPGHWEALDVGDREIRNILLFFP